jgi:hypothetical protein
MKEPMHIETNAIFGQAYLAQVTYRDDGQTLHGPFETGQEAANWLDARSELDYKDFVGEGEVIVMNLVREKNTSPYEKKLVV